MLKMPAATDTSETPVLARLSPNERFQRFRAE
jgi:hypothetical protein